MSTTSTIINEFLASLDEIQKFTKNLIKENAERRKDYEANVRKLEKLEQFKLGFCELKNRQCKHSSEKDITVVAEIAIEINDCINKAKTILNDRLNKTSNSEDNPIDIENIDNFNNMGEKFNLKTAASLLPVFNGTDVTTHELIDAIELYDSMLEAAGKPLLTSYVLKRCLSAGGKLRLKSNYADNQLLVADIKKHFLPVKSAGVLSVKLNTAQQGNRSIEEFGKSVEQLLVDLTITQAGENKDSLNVLQQINEKIAINAFSNGLNNSETRTIVKSRNCCNLAEALRIAKDEENVNRKVHVYHARGNSHQKFNGRGHHNSSRGNQNYNTNRFNFNKNNKNQNRQNNPSNCNYSRTGFNNNYRGRGNGTFNSRRGQQNFRNRQQNAFVTNVSDESPSQQNNNLFFRSAN